MATMTKMDAVRKALSELGKHAQPVQIQEWVKETFGMDMTTAHISNYKTFIARKRKGRKSAKSLAEADAHETGVAVEAAPVKRGRPALNKAASGAGLNLMDIETVKSLMVRVGENDLKSLIDLLGK